MRLVFYSSPAAAGLISSGDTFQPTTQADLIVLPELGFDQEPEPSDGPLTLQLRQQCANAGTAILFGYREACSGEVFNAMQMINGSGIAIGNYRCTHPATSNFGTGRWLTILPFSQHRIGILIGDDLMAPEVWRSLALSDVSLILWSGRDYDQSAGILRTRALENGLSVMGCDARSVHGFDAAGQALWSETKGDAIELECRNYQPSGPPLRRQPILYKRLVSEASSA